MRKRTLEKRRMGGTRLTALLICLGTLSISASVNAELLRSFGTRIGPQYSDLSYHSKYFGETSAGSRWGLCVGVFSEWSTPLHEVLSIVTESTYSQRGFVEQLISIDGSSRSSERLQSADYLSFGIIFKAGQLRGPVRPYLLIGPTFDTKIRSDDSQMLDALRDRSVGLTGGAGLAIPLRGHSMLIEFRFSGELGSAGEATDDHWVSHARTHGNCILAGFAF